MNCRHVLLAVCLAVVVPSAAIAKVAPWIEVRSPHFRVLTNGNVSDARDVANDFERMRYVFASRFVNLQLDSGAPMLIFAARDENTAKSLEPELWKRKGAKPAGLFKHGWEKQYVMVDLDAAATGLNTYALVYHEYTHSILHMNARWLPKWLDEGLAEFYGYTQFQNRKIMLGAPSGRLFDRQLAPIPMKTLLEVTPNSPYYHDDDKANEFYFESWALVHYLTFGPGMGNGAKLNQFFAALQKGGEQEQAFQQVFGSLTQVDKELDHYMQQFSFMAFALPEPTEINEKTFTVTKLTVAETEAQLAGYHLWSHDLASARPLVMQALIDDPKLGLPHEEEGFLLFADGEDSAAAAAFSQAYALDPSLYLSLFAKTMLSPIATSNVPADEATLHAALLQVATLNEQFAPAYVQLARLAVRENQLDTALRLSRTAEEREPWRAGYHLLTGQILLRMGKDAEAASFARFVANHWVGPDHDEAVELWNSIPAAQRSAGTPLVVTLLPPGVKHAEGTIQSIACESKGQPWTLALQSDGHPLTFHTEGGFAFGFSDTLWYGEDHVSTCRHLDGLRAIVIYHPAANAGDTGNVGLEVRDDLPPEDSTAKRPTVAVAR